MESKRRGWWAQVGVGVLTLLGLYVGAYYALVDYKSDLEASYRNGKPILLIQPEYRLADSVAQVLFHPIHQADIALRPGEWRFP